MASHDHLAHANQVVGQLKNGSMLFDSPMQALILVGGYGTRLRPLTFSMAKPLVPFCNMPILEHQIAALVRVGVNRVVLAVCYRPEDMESFINMTREKYNVEVVFSIEDTPLGTAGPLALAKDKLIGNSPFFVLNSDVICNFPFEEFLKFHKAHGKEGSIMVTKVKDPSKYGVVVSDSTGKIERFVEKPKQFVGDKINAGVYCFNKSIIDRIKPLVPTSIEREIFPEMTKEGDLYRFVLPGYWMDIGQPKDFLTGMCLHLESLDEKKTQQSSQTSKTSSPVSSSSSKNSLKRRYSNSTILDKVVIDPSASVGDGCKIGPNVTIGPNCVIEEGVRIKRAAIFDGVHVKRGAFINSCIVGWKSRIGSWSRMEDLCVIGEDVTVDDEIHVRSCTVCPHKRLRTSLREPQIIL